VPVLQRHQRSRRRTFAPLKDQAPNVSGKEAVKEEAAEARNRQKSREVGNKLKDEFLYLYYIFNLYYTACRGNKVLFVF
jgi:hypothetical protein